MFLGTFYSKLESKSRLLIPKKLRQDENNWIVTLGLEQNLALYKLADFNEETNKIADLKWNQKINRDYLRLFLNLANEVIADNLGRILLPDYLLERGELKKEVVVVGSGKLIEIWDRDNYYRYWQDLEKKRSEIAEGVIV